MKRQGWGGEEGGRGMGEEGRGDGVERSEGWEG